MRIGLFGGTFDPPHAAHRAACLIALHRLGLDRVWWLVTPGNPLKDTRGLAPLEAAHRRRRALAHHPRIDVTGFEADIGTSYTYETVAYLRRHCPGVHFVWIMGADNLRSFHRWQKWRGIAAWSRSRWSTASARASMPPPAPPARRSRGSRSGGSGTLIGEPQTAGLGLPPWPEIAAVVHRAARIAAAVIKPMPKCHSMRIVERQPVETVNPPCLS